MLEEHAQSRLRLLVFLECQERGEFSPDEFLIESAMLSNYDSFDIDPIPRAARESFKDDEILRGADLQGDAFGQTERHRSAYGPVLERHGPQGNIQRKIPFRPSKRMTRCRSANARAPGMRGEKADKN